MRKLIQTVLLLTVAMLALGSLNSSSAMAETKMIGNVEKIDYDGPNATTATVILKDTKTEVEVTIIVNDELTLDKFKDHRIQLGDEIRCKYETVNGQNVSTYFRKTAGC